MNDNEIKFMEDIIILQQSNQPCGKPKKKKEEEEEEEKSQRKLLSVNILNKYNGVFLNINS